jgi:hypothetical protein
MIGADLPCRTFIVYHHGLFAQGLRSILEDRSAVKIVGMECDVAKALKAVRALQPEVIIVEECTGKHQPMRLGAFLHSAGAGRVVTLSLDHGFATVYQRTRVPATDLGLLTKAIQGGSTPPPAPDSDRQRGAAASSAQHEVAVTHERQAGAQVSKRLTRGGDRAGVEDKKTPTKRRAG